MSRKNPNTKKEQRGASHAGFHFGNLYMCCPMKFFIRYLLRIEPKRLAPPLITGTAFHEGKAIWYTTKSEKKAISKVVREIENRRDDYEYEERFDKDVIRFPLLLEVWIEKFGRSDIKNFTILGVEDEIVVPVPGTNNFKMTMRLDLVYREKLNEKLFIHDTKTSSFSKVITDNTLYYGDQATAYLWAVEEKYKEKPYALIGDVAYWNKNAKSEDNIDCYRTEWITRSDTQIGEYQESVASLFNEIAQKVTAWKTGNFSKTQLFQRNTFYCNSYAKPCEYADICRTNVEEKKRVPFGFTRAHKMKSASLTNFTFDEIPYT